MSSPTAGCQACCMTYARRGESGVWEATAQMLERFSGVRSRGVVACRAEDRRAVLLVFLDCEPGLCEPGASVPDLLARAMAGEAVRLADRRFLAERPGSVVVR